jgi:hypothetical protein
VSDILILVRDVLLPSGFIFLSWFTAPTLFGLIALAPGPIGERAYKVLRVIKKEPRNRDDSSP